MQKVFALALLFSPLSMAIAASSADLTVTGTLTPSACIPTLSAGGRVDHGKISAKSLNQEIPTDLPRQTVQFAINCEALRPLKLAVIDNRQGSSTSDKAYGLGFINGTQKLGGFFVNMLNAMDDGVPRLTLGSKDGGATWSFTQWMDPTYPLYTVSLFSDTSRPIQAKNVTMDLTIITSIARADSLNLTEQVTLDGSITLEVGYL